MKLLISVFLVGTIFILTKASKWEDKAKLVRERYEKIKKTCADKHHFTAKELEDYESRMAPENQKEKCMLACILTQAGIMADGKFSRSGSDELTAYLYDDTPELQVKSREISKRCEKLVEEAKLTDECDIAQQVFLCVRKTSKQLGFKD